jgi:hypothetical protein
MPPKAADLNPKDWKYHFNRHDKAAREGRHLPTIEELYCGMSGEPAMATALVASAGLANPLIILDEIEKAATSKYNGNLLDALLPFLETRSASKYHDIFVQAPVDLSGVVWLATANDVKPLPKPFRDRCRILAFPSPTHPDLPALVPRLSKRRSRHWTCWYGKARSATSDVQIIPAGI